MEVVAHFQWAVEVHHNLAAVVAVEVEKGVESEVLVEHRLYIVVEQVVDSHLLLNTGLLESRLRRCMALNQCVVLWVSCRLMWLVLVDLHKCSQACVLSAVVMHTGWVGVRRSA